MLRNFTICIVTLAVLASFGTTSFAETTDTERVRGVWRATTYSVDPGWPNVGSSHVAVGSIRNNWDADSVNNVALGWQRRTITGHPSRYTWTYKTILKSYTDRRDPYPERMTMTGKFTIRNGWVLDTARGRVRNPVVGLTGKVRSTGRNRVNARVFKYALRGTFTWAPSEQLRP